MRGRRGAARSTDRRRASSRRSGRASSRGSTGADGRVRRMRIVVRRRRARTASPGFVAVARTTRAASTETSSATTASRPAARPRARAVPCTRSRCGRRCATARRRGATISRRPRSSRSRSRPHAVGRGLGACARRARAIAELRADAASPRARSSPRSATTPRCACTNAPASAATVAPRCTPASRRRCSYGPDRRVRRRGRRSRPLMARVAPRLGVVDQPGSAEGARATRAVPRWRRGVPRGRVPCVAFERPSVLVPLGLALALGVVDDVGDLRAEVRLGGEVAVGVAPPRSCPPRRRRASSTVAFVRACSSTRSTCSTGSTGWRPVCAAAGAAGFAVVLGRYVVGGRARARRRARRVPRVEPAAGAHLPRRRRELPGRHRARAACSPTAWGRGERRSRPASRALLFVAVPVADMAGRDRAARPCPPPAVRRRPRSRVRPARRSRLARRPRHDPVHRRAGACSPRSASASTALPAGARDRSRCRRRHRGRRGGAPRLHGARARGPEARR